MCVCVEKGGGGYLGFCMENVKQKKGGGGC